MFLADDLEFESTVDFSCMTPLTSLLFEKEFP